jgi:hypothetical protein
MKSYLFLTPTLLLISCVAPSEFEEFGTTSSYSDLTPSEKALSSPEIPIFIDEPIIEKRYNQISEWHEINFKIGVINYPVALDWDYLVKNGQKQLVGFFIIHHQKIRYEGDEYAPVPFFLQIGDGKRYEKNFGLDLVNNQLVPNEFKNVLLNKKIDYIHLLEIALIKENNASKSRITALEQQASDPRNYRFAGAVQEVRIRSGFQREVLIERQNIEKRNLNFEIFSETNHTVDTLYGVKDFVDESNNSITFTQEIINWLKQNPEEDVLIINAIGEYETKKYKIRRSHLEKIFTTLEEAQIKSKNS